jgi:hypothetical protein
MLASRTGGAAGFACARAQMAQSAAPSHLRGSAMLRLPRPLRTWLRNRRRVRHAIERHPVPALTDYEKRLHLIDWARRAGVRVFVETGTFRGETTLALRQVVERCVTIELDPALHERARAKFAGIDGIEALLGDSGELIPRVLATLDEPALFWLDGHYSGAGTGRGEKDSPILRELSAIFGHKVKEHVVIIDDARDFIGSNGYPSVRELARFAERNGYLVRIRDDLIRLYARPGL